jgi:hypothetical protein
MRYQRIRELDGKEVPYEQVAKGLRARRPPLVVLDEDPEKPITTDKVIDVVESRTGRAGGRSSTTAPTA